MSDGKTAPLAGTYTGSMASSDAGTTTRSAGVDTLISPTSVSRRYLLRSVAQPVLAACSFACGFLMRPCVSPWLTSDCLACIYRNNMRRTCTAWSAHCSTLARRRTFPCCTTTAFCPSSSGCAVGQFQDWECSARLTLCSLLVTSSPFWLTSTQLAGPSTR